MSEYTDEFLGDWLYWRPMLEGGLYNLGSDVDMDDVIRANLWLDMKARIAKAVTPKPKGTT